MGTTQTNSRHSSSRQKDTTSNKSWGAIRKISLCDYEKAVSGVSLRPSFYVSDMLSSRNRTDISKRIAL